ncbi:MAG TPA: sensor histidine kinase [Clostridia bacterium]|nr:sensor histidine kinase [Clostridia bacterium]
MSIWKRYLKDRRKAIAVFGLFALVFAVSFALYRLPLGAVLYAASLCAFFGLLILIRDIRAYWTAHRRMEALGRGSALSADDLPPPRGLSEEDHQAILRRLLMDKARLESELQGRYTDLVEYYTAWVHQIKTPIASMHLTLQQEDSPMGRDISENLRQIEQYVEMVLCYLRLDSPSTDYVFREYDLDGILKQALRKFATQFIHRKIRLRYEPVRFKVLTDEKWLLFVIEQLLSNALKYTPSGGTVTLALEEPGVLSVRDTGIGIAPEDLPRIFDKGYTGYNGRADKKASGIGLYLCKRICSNLRHGISAESAPGNGTVVRLNLNREKLEIE